MPAVLYKKGYRFWFYEPDLDEPPHVHVGKNGKRAKYWLMPLAQAWQTGFRERELTAIERILGEEGGLALAIWRWERQKRDHAQSQDVHCQ